MVLARRPSSVRERIEVRIYRNQNRVQLMKYREILFHSLSIEWASNVEIQFIENDASLSPKFTFLWFRLVHTKYDCSSDLEKVHMKIPSLLKPSSSNLFDLRSPSTNGKIWIAWIFRNRIQQRKNSVRWEIINDNCSEHMVSQPNKRSGRKKCSTAMLVGTRFTEFMKCI